MTRPARKLKETPQARTSTDRAAQARSIRLMHGTLAGRELRAALGRAERALVEELKIVTPAAFREAARAYMRYCASQGASVNERKRIVFGGFLEALAPLLAADQLALFCAWWEVKLEVSPSEYLAQEAENPKMREAYAPLPKVPRRLRLELGYPDFLVHLGVITEEVKQQALELQDRIAAETGLTPAFGPVLHSVQAGRAGAKLHAQALWCGVEYDGRPTEAFLDRIALRMRHRALVRFGAWR